LGRDLSDDLLVVERTACGPLISLGMGAPGKNKYFLDKILDCNGLGHFDLADRL
jgi:hypothetical protein